MDHHTKNEDQKEVEKNSPGRGEASVQNTSDTTSSEGKSVPADRDAGTLQHGEMGGNFGEEQGEEKSA